MKRLLSICVLIHVVLAGVLWWNLHERYEQSMVRILRMAAGESPESPTQRIPQGSSVSAKPATRWDLIETKDLKQFLANLRAVGCPEQTIRDLVMFRVFRNYRRQLLDREAEAQRSRNYTQLVGHREWQERTWQRGEMSHAMECELESLLGMSAADLRAVLFGERAMERDRSYIGLEKRGRLREIEQQQEELAHADRQRKEEKERMRLREQTRLTKLANEVGIDQDLAIRFFNRLEQEMPVLEKEFEVIAKSMDGSLEKAEEFKAAVHAEFNKLAVEILGEKGPELVKKLLEEPESIKAN